VNQLENQRQQAKGKLYIITLFHYYKFC
jgi:hypothetical protein